MPFTFKLSKRLALMKAWLALAAAASLVACERVAAPTQPSTSVVQVITSPDTVTLDPYQTRQFLAYGRTQPGDSVPVAVHWSVSGGTISTGGLYSADTTAGTYLVTATATTTTASISGSSQVKNRGQLSQVIVTPATASVSVGGTLLFA